MELDRRVLLKGLGATVLGSTALSSLSAAEQQQLAAQSQTNGVHLAADFTEDSRVLGLSDVVRVESAADPTRPGEGRSRDRDVLHITSLPAEEPGRGGEGRGRGDGGRGNDGADESENGNDDGAFDDRVTFDYGFSILGLSDRALTVRDLATFGGGSGLAYEWLVTEENVSAVGTEDEAAGVGPDEAWLIVREPSGTETGLVEDALAGRLAALVREFEQDRGTGEWFTRDVGVELDDDSEPAWQELTAASGLLVDLRATPLAAYGDAEVLAVGVGRGDPYDGPSVLDAYYRNLQVAGEEYSFPRATHGSRRGSGRGG